MGEPSTTANMLTGKLALLVLSFLVGIDARRSLEKSSSSSSSTSTSGSDSTSKTTRSSSGSSSSSSDGHAYYRKSSKSSSTGSNSSHSESRYDSSSDEKVNVPSRCKNKKHVSFIVNQPFGKKLSSIAQFFTERNIRATFVVDGMDLVNSLNYLSDYPKKTVQIMNTDNHILMILPSGTKSVKDMNAKELLAAVQRSAIGIQQVLNAHPVLVHIPGGLSHGKDGQKKAALLKRHGYIVVHHSKSFDSHGRSLKSLKRSRRKHRSHKKSRKHGRRHHKHRRSRRAITSSSSTTSSSSSSTTSSSTEHRIRRSYRKHRHHKKFRGNIIYGHQGHKLGPNIEKTVRNLKKKGYTFVSLTDCISKHAYRRVTDLATSSLFLA